MEKPENVYKFEGKKHFEDSVYGLDSGTEVLEQLYIQKAQYKPELKEETIKFLVSAKTTATQFALEGDADAKIAVPEINKFLNELRGVKDGVGGKAHVG